jgi:predicted nucleic acid-binding protein
LRFRLGSGEAACLALAVERDLVLVTDDSDALAALEALRAGHPYERIRKLLRRAANSKLITRKRAREIHDAMRQAGFWDVDGTI